MVLIDRLGRRFSWLHKYSAKGHEVTIKGIEFDVGYNFKKIEIVYNYSIVHGINETLDSRPLSYMNPTKHILNFNYFNDFFVHKLRLTKINDQYRLGEFETFTPGAFLIDYILTFKYR